MPLEQPSALALHPRDQGEQRRCHGNDSVGGSGGDPTVALHAPGGGGTDKFRIRIYGVYDNQLGAPDGDEPTTALGGGSIVIHKPK